jgi:hypothetical protein
MAKFDYIIMNPPYSRNLHLKILNNALDYSDDIVNLSPVRWLQDPLAELKKNSDWNKFKDIRDRIESIKVIDNFTAESMFNISLPFNIGIYHITSNKTNYCNKFKNLLIEKMVSCIKDPISNHIVIDDLSGISLLVSLVIGGDSGRLEVAKSKPWGLSKEKAFYYNGLNEASGETYYEYSSRIAWGNVKPKTENTNIKFNTKEERLNFFNSWNTKCLKYLVNKITVCLSTQAKFMPYLQSYNHPWTDEMLYKYFDLTDEEILEIEYIIK